MCVCSFSLTKIFYVPHIMQGIANTVVNLSLALTEAFIWHGSYESVKERKKV